MRLEDYDGKRVSIETVSGKTFEGVCTNYGDEYCFYEYGRNEDCLYMYNFLFFGDEIKRIAVIDRYEKPFGLIEELTLQEGADFVADALEDGDTEFVKRLLACLKYHAQRGELTDKSAFAAAIADLQTDDSTTYWLKTDLLNALNNI